MGNVGSRVCIEKQQFFLRCHFHMLPFGNSEGIISVSLVHPSPHVFVADLELCLLGRGPTVKGFGLSDLLLKVPTWGGDCFLSKMLYKRRIHPIHDFTFLVETVKKVPTNRMKTAIRVIFGMDSPAKNKRTKNNMLAWPHCLLGGEAGEATGMKGSNPPCPSLIGREGCPFCGHTPLSQSTGKDKATQQASLLAEQW